MQPTQNATLFHVAARYQLSSSAKALQDGQRLAGNDPMTGILDSPA